MVASRADDDTVTLGDGVQQSEWRIGGKRGAVSLAPRHSLTGSTSAKARMPVLADIDVIVHQYSERRRYRRSRGSSAHPPARARIAERLILLIQVAIAVLRESPVVLVFGRRQQ